MQAFGGIELSVDGRSIDPGKTLAYKGVMMSGVPNLASVFGYINASWTLKADLICDYVCRLLNFMDRKGVRQVTPKNDGETAAAPFVERFSPGYMQRALGELAETGFQGAVARLSELHPRHDQPEVGPGRRPRAGVFQPARTVAFSRCGSVALGSAAPAPIGPSLLHPA